MLEESIKTPATPVNSLALRLNYVNNAKIRVKFDSSCLKQDKVSFTHGNSVNVLIVYELYMWSRDLNTDFTLKFCLFGAVKLTRNADPNKCSYSRYRIVFNSQSHFLVSNLDFGKNDIIFGAGNSSLTHIDNRKKYI